MYSRIISDKILNSLSSHEIIFLLGTRQVGKTTLTKMTMDVYKIEPKQKIYYDLENNSKQQLFKNTNKNYSTGEGVRQSIEFLLQTLATATSFFGTTPLTVTFMTHPCGSVDTLPFRFVKLEEITNG